MSGKVNSRLAELAKPQAKNPAAEPPAWIADAEKPTPPEGGVMVGTEG
jgi:hypothetical protein